jgi:hypothetical protein
MAHNKLDMGKAWTQATGLIGSNRDTIGAIAGLFFFLPSLALALFAPELVNPEPAAPAGADPQVAMQAALDQMSKAYTDNWALFLALTIVQFVGSMSLLALLTDRGRPTVGEAMGIGIRSIPTYLAAQILSALAVGLAVGIPLGIVAAAGSPIAAVLVGFVLVLVGAYLFVKFSLIAPVIAIDGVRNPITALRQSWRLTKGNSFRIVAFVLLLFFTIGIISALVSGILGLVFSALGGQIADIGNGIVSAAVNTLIGVIFLVVIAAVHRQLAGHSPEGLAKTFE